MSAAPSREIVTIQHQHASAPRQASISRKLKRAIDLMVWEGKKRAEAALEAGITDDAVRKALNRPDVCAYRNTQMEVVRTSAASRTIARAETLADEAQSEHVRLQANTWLAGIEGISPVVKSESVNTHRHLMAGLVIVRGPETQPDDDAHLIGGQAREVRSQRQINRIGKSVPHPSMRNAQVIEAKPAGKSEAGE